VLKHGLTIQTKLILGFACILLLMVATTVVYMQTLHRLHLDAEHLQSIFTQAWFARQVESQANRMLKEVSDLVTLGERESPDEYEESRAAVARSFKAWEREITRDRSCATCNPLNHMVEECASLSAVARLRQRYESIANSCQQALDLTRQGRRDEVLKILHGTIEMEFDQQFAAALGRIIARKTSQIETLQAAAERRRASATTLFLYSAIVALGTGLLCSIRITRSIMAPIRALHKATVRISQGDLDIRTAIHGDDELGQLAESFDDMARSLKQSSDDLRLQIAQRLTIEKQQEQTVVQLEMANAELRDFAHIVSHDLKAPLRGIKVLAEWLCHDYADKLDVSGVEQLHLLHHRVDRMHDLIDGILRYSRVGRDAQESAAVDLNTLLPEIVDTIAPPAHIRVSIQKPMPVIFGQAAQVTQVFQNLIGNAVKYMDKPEGRIVVACEDEDNLWKFSVVDNGPGIETKHFQKIFQIFQTLSPKDAYESTGIGLALVKKIVELHGGTTSVESQVERGSTFFFTWPKDKLVVDRQSLVDNSQSCRLTTALTEDD
jgi:signal transduction histidine kinase